MKKLNKQGFSMIELLVVLLIIGILAAVAAPLFLGNSARAIASEAVAGAGAIRSAERSYFSQYNNYQFVAIGDPSYFSTGGANSAVLGVTIHGNKYFSPEAYSVATAAGGGAVAWMGAPAGGLPAPLDFVITITGANSLALSAANPDGASALFGVGVPNPVANYVIQMDNSGTVIYTSNFAPAAGPVVWQRF